MFAQAQLLYYEVAAMDVTRLVGAHGISDDLMRRLGDTIWEKRMLSHTAIHGRHAAVFAVGASEAVGRRTAIRVGKSVFTAWPVCADGHCPVLLVFRYNLSFNLDGYFVEKLDGFLDWIDLPPILPGTREDWFVAHARPRLRPEAVINGNQLADGIRTSYSLRVLDGLPML